MSTVTLPSRSSDQGPVAKDAVRCDCGEIASPEDTFVCGHRRHSDGRRCGQTCCTKCASEVGFRLAACTDHEESAARRLMQTVERYGRALRHLAVTGDAYTKNYAKGSFDLPACLDCNDSGRMARWAFCSCFTGQRELQAHLKRQEREAEDDLPSVHAGVRSQNMGPSSPDAEGSTPSPDGGAASEPVRAAAFLVTSDAELDAERGWWAMSEPITGGKDPLKPANRPPVRLSLTADEIVAMLNFVGNSHGQFRALFEFLGKLAQAPIYRGGALTSELEITVEGEPHA